MQLLRFMEKVGSSETNFIIDLIREGFFHIQSDFPENIETSYIDIVSGTSLYDLPVDFVANDGVEISKSLPDYESYGWTIFGRQIKLLKQDTDGTYIAPTSSLSEGLAIIHSTENFLFTLNPDGDSNEYDHISTDTTAVSTNEVVYIVDGHSAGGSRFHYYKALADVASVDLSSVDFTDTDTWEDVTQVASPNELSYINVDKNLIQALLYYVKSKLVEDTDPKLAEYRLAKMRGKATTAKTIRRGRKSMRVIPKKIFSIR